MINHSQEKVVDGKKGFTLIELLVVIAIISILAAILFPVFARARENARRTSCLSNVKQLGLGLMQYTQDYDEMYPILGWGPVSDPIVHPNGVVSTNSWVMRIYPYVKSVQIFNCPSNTRTPWTGGTSSGASTSPHPSYSVSYGANNQLIGAGGFTAISIASVAKVADTLMFADSAGDNPYMINNVYSATRWMEDRHLDGANIVFADGHAKWKKMSRNSSGQPIPPGPAQGVYWYAHGNS